MLGMSKDPLADSKQSVTLYTVPSPFRVKVRSLTEAACKVATSNGNIKRYLDFILQLMKYLPSDQLETIGSVIARD